MKKSDPALRERIMEAIKAAGSREEAFDAVVAILAEYEERPLASYEYIKVEDIGKRE